MTYDGQIYLFGLFVIAATVLLQNIIIPPNYE